MIIDFHKCYGGGGSGSGVTPQEVQAQIDSALTPYWDSAATESAITEALSGISLDGYYTSAQTDEKIASAVTPVSEHLAEVEQVTASAYTELHDGLLEVSARTVDMSGFYTSAQTDEKIASAASITYASAVSYTDAALSGFTPAGDSTVLKGVFNYPAEPELGDMVSKLETMPTFWWYDGDNTTLKMHIDPLILDTGKTYKVISFETQADGVLYGRILYDDRNQVITLKFFDEEDNEVYLLGNLNKARYLGIAIGDGYYVSIGFLDDDFTSEGGRMLQVGRTDGTFGNWQGNTGQIPELEVEDIEVEDERTGEMIPGIPAATGPWFYNGNGWVSVGDYASGPIWNTINTINSDIETLNSDIDTLDEVVSAALVDLNDRVDEKVESQDIKHIVKLTQAEYDALVDKDYETFYIIINNIS